MTVLTLTDPVAGTLADASLIANNDAAIKAVINGGIDNNNFAGGRIFDPDKIMQGAASAGNVLVWNGFTWVRQSVGFIKAPPKTVNTTVAATDLLSGAVTIPGQIMANTGCIRLTAYGTIKNNSGVAAAPPRFQLVFGGTTLLDTNVGGTMTNSTAIGTWRMVCEIQNVSAVNSQVATMQLTMISGGGVTAITDVPFAVGSGRYTTGPTAGDPPYTAVGLQASGALNTQNPLALLLNVINGSASATYETVLAAAMVELL